MPSKRALLEQLTRQELLEIATLSFVEVSTGNKLADGEAGLRRTVLHQLMKRYSADRLRELCRALGIDDSGNDKERIIERLIWKGTAGSSDDALSWTELAAEQEPPRRRKISTGTTHVQAVASRSARAIDFPNVVGFAVAKEALRCNVDKVAALKIEPQGDPTANLAWTPNGWVVSNGEVETAPAVPREQFYKERPLERTTEWLALYITEILAGGRVPMENPPKSALRLEGARALFQDVHHVVAEYLSRRVTVSSRRARIEDVALACYRDAVIERLVSAIELDADASQPILLPVLDSTRPVFSTAEVQFRTKKPTTDTTKSQISHVVVDGQWEDCAAFFLEQSPNVAAYVKNDQPYFGILYEWKGSAHKYAPDFLVRIANATWIVEMERPSSEDDESRWTAAAKWITAMNNHGGFGRWKHVVCRNADVLRRLVAEPAPPTTCDGTELTRGKPTRYLNDLEWWERPRSISRTSGRRRADARWSLSGAIALPAPSSESPAGSRQWAIPCRCGESWCDGIRYVRASEGQVNTQFVCAHPDDPAIKTAIRSLARLLVDQAISDARAAEGAKAGAERSDERTATKGSGGSKTQKGKSRSSKGKKRRSTPETEGPPSN